MSSKQYSVQCLSISSNRRLDCFPARPLLATILSRTVSTIQLNFKAKTIQVQHPNNINLHTRKWPKWDYVLTLNCCFDNILNMTVERLPTRESEIVTEASEASDYDSGSDSVSEFYSESSFSSYVCSCAFTSNPNSRSTFTTSS